MSFVPGPGTERAYRDALGRFTTGVTVVTCEGPDGPVGITANSFASVSLDPPLVLWSPSRASTRFAVFADARHYSIHVLGEDQRDLGAAFARHPSDPFSAAATDVTAEGVTVLAGCLARFDCVLHARHAGGDHEIVLGRVVRAEAREGDPLAFHAGRYGTFVPHHGA